MKLEESIGNTPLIELKNHGGNPKVKIYAKLEGSNPGGSVKDRAAYFMIKDAIDKGSLKTGDTIIEATSGNTGIALAMIGRILDVKVILVMPENSTEERIHTMKAYGAEVILTPAEKTIEYSRTYALELADKQGYHILNQFANKNNPRAHYEGTGPEIWRDTKGEITHFVSAMGTTGTIMGVSKYLKEKNKDVRIVGAQPADGESIPGIRRWSKELVPEIFEPLQIDDTMEVKASDAETYARRLAKNEAIFAGVSSGGAYYIASKLAEEITEGVIVFIACDRGDRYLSTQLYREDGK